MSDAVGGLSTVVLLIMIATIWQGIHILILSRRLRRANASITRHQRALVSMHVAGMLSDDDWDRANTPVGRRRRTPTFTIEPVRRPPVGGSGGSDAYRMHDIADHWFPKPPTVGPRGGAGDSGAAKR